ncbi:MAG: DNA polymerase II [Acidobacteriota bacterium]
MADLGFILQPTYRIIRRRPVVHLFGVLESGESFLVRDDREKPDFFIRTADAERAAKLGVPELETSDWTTFDGYPASRVRFRLPSDAPALRDELSHHGIRCYEADVRFATRYLMRRGIRGSLRLEGPWRSGRPADGPGLDRVYDNPEIEPASWQPTLTVLSLDIETDMRADRLFSIALFGAGASEVLLHSPPGLATPEGARGFEDERSLLEAFAGRVRAIDPDVVTGWNVVDFDLKVLDKLAERHGVRLDLGRRDAREGSQAAALRLRPTRSPFSSLEATIPGRVVLDGIELMRGAFIRRDSYSLSSVSGDVLGESKLIEGDDRGLQISKAFEKERDLLVRYNLQDARLVVDILAQLQLVDLAVARSRLTGLPVDRVAGSIAAFDFLYLEQLSRRRIAAPSVEKVEDSSGNLGGHVLEPDPGLWNFVLVFDFKSLYPSLIRTFQIDPLGLVARPDGQEDLIEAPNGAAFSRRPGILPALLDDLFPRREEAKRAGDEVASHAIKILMNSFYGVLGTTACRFYEPKLATAITALGREILLWSKARLEAYGYRVLYGDTDSLFVLSGADRAEHGRRLGRELVERLNDDVRDHLADTWGVTSRLELEFEKLYLQLLLQSQRGSKAGARKRYAGLVDDGSSEGAEASERAGHVEFTGLEVVRRDWTELAKSVQKGLYERLFRGRDIEGFLKESVQQVRAGERDGEMVYRKALRKPLEAYTATTPPHVAAARKLRGKKAGRVIRYVMTQAGPEPADELRSRVDHEHYVQKQIRPIAEPVLAVLGLDFDRVVGDDAQLSLF